MTGEDARRLLAEAAAGDGLALGIGAWTVVGYTALLGAFFLSIVAHGVLVWLLPQHTDRDITLDRHNGGPALALGYSATLFVILVAIMGCLTLILGLGTVDLPRRAGTARPPAGLLFAAATILFGSFLVVTVTGRLARGVVMLTPVRGLPARASLRVVPSLGVGPRREGPPRRHHCTGAHPCPTRRALGPSADRGSLVP